MSTSPLLHEPSPDQDDRSAFDDAATGLAVLDLSGRFLRVNRALCRMVGRSPDELIGLRPHDITHPDDQAVSEATFDELSAERWRVNRARKRYVRPDGSIVVVDRIVSALRDADGRMTGMLTQILDATEVSDAQQALRSSERRFRALVAKSWDVITLHDAEGRYLYASPGVTAQFGTAPEDLIGVDPFPFIDDRDGAVAAAFFTAPVDGRASDPVEYRMRKHTGGWVWLESVCRNLLADPAVGGIVVTTRDITVRKRRTAQQDAVAALSRATLADGCLEAVLAEAVATVGDVLGIDDCSILRKKGDEHLHVVTRRGRPIVERPYPMLQDGLPMTREAQALHERRSIMWTSDVDGGIEPLPELRAAGLQSGLVAVIQDGTGEPWGAVVARSKEEGAFAADDISFLEAVANVIGAAAGRRRVDDELRSRASTDALTGLPNRSALRQELRSTLLRLQHRPGSVAVLFVDTDDLKLVNDSLGHAAGDAVISAVASRIVDVVRVGDIVARFGGDEFIVLCEHADADEATAIADRILAALTEPIALHDQTVTVTASIGIAVATDAAGSRGGIGGRAESLLAEADTAMYKAKRSGKDRAALFGAEMRLEVNERLEIVSGLRRALRSDRLELVFQPIVDVEGHRIVAAEALLRWPDGAVGPDRFIPIAEDSGLIHLIGGWVLEQALRQAATWQAAGRDLMVTINVSGLQLAVEGFVETVRDQLRSTGADPSGVTLEVTESGMMGDIDHVIPVLEGLHDLGVRLALDDFGTGHSSLSRLAHLPFDYVKIDRSFIARTEEEDRALALVEGIAGLCRALGLDAVAEGVETPEQFATLRRLGIPFAQGYLLGRPGPSEAFPASLDMDD